MISDRTFSRLSTIAAALIASIAKPLCYLAGIELDSVGGARKLSQLGIQHIVIQHKSPEARGHDGVILDRASLATELHQDPSLKNVNYLEDENMFHGGSLPNSVEDQFQSLITAFFNA